MQDNTNYKQTEIGEIPEDWSVACLADFTSLNPQRILKKKQDAKYVSMANLQPFDKKIVNFEIKPYNGGVKFINTDSLLARITPCLENGKTAFVDILDDNEVGFGSTEFIVLNGKESKTDSQYVYYLSRSPKFRDIAIKSMVGSSGRQRVQIDKLASSVFAFPSLLEQQQIASILSSLDDKIELNRKMNKTLEEIGKALFKRWFVDFEFPNNDGKPLPAEVLMKAGYKSSGGEMVDSGIGEIPKDWKVGKLADEFNILMGQSPPGNTYNNEGVGLPFYQGRTDFGDRYPTKRIYCSVPARVAKQNDTLLSVRAPVGDINQATEKCCIGRGVASISKDGYASYTFYKTLYLRRNFQTYDQEGTVFGSITKDDLAKIVIVIPQLQIVRKYEDLLTKIDKQIYLKSSQINLLSSIRDSLLPRLMSGKLRVNDYE